VRLSRGKIRLLLDTLEVEDFRTLLNFTVRKLTRPLFNVYYVFEFELDRAHKLSDSTKPLPEGIGVRLFQGEEEIGWVAGKLSCVGLPTATTEQRMRQGDLVALALANDEELAAYTWTTFTDAWIPDVGATLPLRRDEALRFDTLVMPQWRGKGLHYPLTAPVFRFLRDQGYRRTLTLVNALNTRPLKTQIRQGKRKVATIISSPILGIVRVRNISPTDGITLKKGNLAARRAEP
jgi:GNAT superfamily N-acetyltransferase